MTERITRIPGRRQLACRIATLLLPAALLTACAVPPQQPAQPTPVIGGVPAAPGVTQQQALRAMAEAQSRIDRITGPLLVNNAPLCKSHSYKLLGFSAKNRYSYSAELADTVQQTFGYGERLQVTTVLGGSGAERVGVLRGDVLLAAENKEIPPGENAERQAAAVLGPLVRGRSLVKLTIERNGAPMSLVVPLTQSCGFSVDLGNADHVNAYADGRRIAITRGMLNFAQSEQELAYVIAREMAHNILGHAGKQRMNATMGGIIDNLIRVSPDLETMTGRSGVIPFPAALDTEADRLGLYLAARAGFGVDAAAAFWQRLAERHPAAVANGYTATHPDNGARLAMLQKTAEEIRAKQAAKRPLLP